MRSLTPTRVRLSSLVGLTNDGHASNVAIDPETDCLYLTVERPGPEGGVEVDIVRLEQQSTSRHRGEIIATFSSPVLAPFAQPAGASQTLDLKYFAADRSLVILLAGGDIATLQLEGPDGDVAPVDVVGSVDSGIQAAAWSPDEEQLVLVTGEDNLVCMTRQFEVVHEEPLRSEDFGEDKFINVGWGSKKTQFHGSLGKAAALASQPSSSSSRPHSLSHPTDDGLPRISFRGDAAFFAISSLDSYPDSSFARRHVRIYSRDAMSNFAPKLSATSESLPGLEGPISWRPSGNLLSGLVRYGYEGGGDGKEGRWEVAMLERNGLRHGGFELREAREVWKDGKVKSMAWNADSEVLAIWLERQEEDVVQLWSMKNYHYYLKQELRSHTSASRLRAIRWHPEQPLQLFLIGDDFVQSRSFVWDTYAARLPMPNDTASVAVVDGKRLLVTPFRTQNTPPPVSSYFLDLPSAPVHVSMSAAEDALAVLFNDGSVQVWDLHTRLPDPATGSKLRAGGKVAEPVLRWSSAPLKAESVIVSQIGLSDQGEVAVLSHTAASDKISTEVIIVNQQGVERRLEAVGASRVLHAGSRGWLTCDDSGSISNLDSDGSGVELGFEPQSVMVTEDAGLIIALSANGKLCAVSLGNDQYLDADPSVVAASVTSFTLTPDFLIYTTSAQTSHYAPLPILVRIAGGDEVSAADREWESRRVERGSLAVVACPSSMSLVLQMPRGNLETIYPRALVLAVVRRDVKEYREAFLACRKHRLDLNILYDLAPSQFMENLSKFVEAVPEVDYLNLFVSALNDSDSAPVLYRDLATSDPRRDLAGKVNTICDALRAVLEGIDLVKYVETILTTHACKRPPDYEAALHVLLRLQSDHPEIVEDAIKYIIFLSDVDQLYDVALGMYNFQLVLMIAQYSQKDPKEYLPFLRELRALDGHEQKFRIDDHLGRRESALRNLHAAGNFEEAVSYLARYELYEEAFKLYAADTERLSTVYDLYGDYLYDRREFLDAALAYTLADRPDKALKAFEKAHAWRELFALALEQQLPKSAIDEMCERVSEHLASRGKRLEAAQLLVDHAGDIDTAVDILCRGSEFGEAYRLVHLHKRTDLLDSTVLPGLEQAQEDLVEVFDEMRGQLEKEMARLQALRRVREEDPESFYIVETEALEGVDVATNASTAFTAFTRYTVAPTTITQTTRVTGQTNRSKHKASKKRAAGRKGTVDEYDYLLSSLSRLVLRVDEKSQEALGLIRYLVVSLPELARDLQAHVLALRRQLAESLDDAWRDREAILDEAVESGGMGFGGDVTKARQMERPIVGTWKGLGVLAN